ncbi:hypothetical protein [Ruminococcus sp.]|uniref:hypothetical protein n=1 Tax=Ruminococcus sp. TaxID=41978 RepID=UPI003867E99B
MTITYDEIYNRMKSQFASESKYDFDEASDAAIRMRVLAGEIFNAMTSLASVFLMQLLSDII